MSFGFRIGIDFGYGFTGIALLNEANQVLDYAVIKHRQLTNGLATRRASRGMRRRAQSRRKRLRDFAAFLKGMGIPPVGTANSQSHLSEQDKKFIGNRLYAYAHLRGWDYIELAGLLCENLGMDESPKSGRAVRETDLYLMEEFGAPVILGRPPQRPKPNSSPDKRERYKENLKNYEKAESIASKQGIAKDEPMSILRWLKPQTSCLGVYTETLSNIRKLERKTNSSDNEEALRAWHEKKEEIENTIGNRDLEKIACWIDERIEACLEHRPADDQARETILVRLGLKQGRDLFRQGKLYRPHRNRHRDQMRAGLSDLMDEALNHLAVIRTAEALARKTDMTVDKIKGRWKKQADSIIQHEYRKKRFSNRRMKKCPVRLEDGQRCKRNVPKRKHVNIRKLLFESEALLMNWQDRDGKLSPGEVKKLLACVDFDQAEIIQDKWNAFFKTHKPVKAKDGDRNKKDALEDIARGSMPGRTGFCEYHLKERLELLKKTDGMKTEAWKRLSERSEVMLSDAPPSLHHKVERTRQEVAKMLERQGYADPTKAPVKHIGIESARFDIAALSAAEGRPFQNKGRYQTRRASNLDELITEQDDLCLYCGDKIYGGGTVDHVFPRARRGGDTALNRVAAHRWCNTQKWRNLSSLNKKAFNALKRNNENKANYIEKRLESGLRLPEDMLAAPVQTMFGAKLLRSQMAILLGLDFHNEEYFPVIRSRETAFFRRRWYPLMDRQKFLIRNPESARDDEEKPGEKDSIKFFHHALDAIVIAANIDWRKIARLERDINASDRNANKKDWKKRVAEARKLTPDLASANLNPERPPAVQKSGDWEAPRRGSWYLKDKKDKGSTKTAKIKLQPLRMKESNGSVTITQRVQIDQLSEKDVNRVCDEKIKMELKKAWEEFKGKDTIPVEWFLGLPEAHPLHPKKRRGVYINVPPQTTKPENVFNIERGKAKHSFAKEENWSAAHVYEYEDEEGKTQTTTIRETGHFYWGSDELLNCRYEENPPENSRLVATFRRGDEVRIGDRWRIDKLTTRSATLKNKAGKTCKIVYNKLQIIPPDASQN